MEQNINITGCSIQTKRTILQEISKQDLAFFNNELLKKKSTFSIIYKDNNETIGYVSYIKFHTDIENLKNTELNGKEITIFIKEDYRNQGIAHEVLKSIVAHSFFSRHLDFIIMSCSSNDYTFNKLIIKNGLKNYSFTEDKHTYIMFNPYKRNNCHCELCLAKTNCLCSLCPNKQFCLINKPFTCKFDVN